MAPGLRRDGSRAKSKQDLVPGDLVLAKVKGFPAWPAKISRPQDFNMEPEPEKFFVQFYATCEIGFVGPADIQVLTSESKRKLYARAQGKTIKYFARAVEEICHAFEKEHKSSSGEPGEVNVGNAIALVSSTTVDNENIENLELLETFHLATKVERESGDATIKKEESQSHAGVSKTDRVPSLLMSKISCQKEQNSISPCPCVNEVKEAQLKNPVVPGGKSLGACEEEHTDQVNDQTCKSLGACEEEHTDQVNGQTCAALQFDSRKACNVERPVKKNVHDKLKSILKNQVNTSRKQIKLRMPRQMKKYSTMGQEKFDTSCAVLKDMEGGGPSQDVDEDNKPKVKGTKRLLKLSGKKLLHKGLEKLMPGKDEGLLHEGSSSSRANKGKKQHNMRNKKSKSAATNSSRPAKRLKRAEGGNDSAGKVVKEATQSASENRADTVRNRKKSASSLKDHAYPQVMIKMPGVRNNKSAAEAVLPPSEQCQTLEATINPSIKHSVACERSSPKDDDGIASDYDMSPMIHCSSRKRKFQVDDEDEERRTLVYRKSTNCVMPSLTDFRSRRRTFLIDDYEDEERRTPVYRESGKVLLTTYSDATSVDKSTIQPENDNTSLGNANHSASEYLASLTEDKSSHAKMYSPVQVGADSPSGCGKVGAVNEDNAIDLSISHNFGKQKCEPFPCYNSKSKASSKSTPTLGSKQEMIGDKLIIDEFRTSVSSGKNVQLTSFKFSSQASESLNHSHDQANLPKTVVPSSLEIDKLMPKVNLKMATTDERSKAVATSLADSKVAESSMKHLIVVTQAKMKPPHIESLHPDNVISGAVHTLVAHGRSSPSPASPLHKLTPENSVTTGEQDHNMCNSLLLPSKPSHHLSYKNQGEIENCACGRPGKTPREGSLSNTIEVAAARDTLVAMVETVTRNKESIRRATRLAIDCAKYGIASEVIDIVLRNLEEESSLHRKVDLWFLLDSITQCSHNQKGIAGASYIPIVQAALPRILVAAAPSGASACENRRQCLKVLRLWLERKIMPEAVLRQYMNDLEVTNDEKDSGLSLKHPFRADQPVDDPIREMEVVLDEYGSNATWQLPGSLSTCTDSGFCKNFGKEIMIESVIASDKIENCAIMPKDKRPHILEDVEGEQEMEDVFISSNEEKGLLMKEPTGWGSCQLSGRSSEISPNNLVGPHPPSVDPPLPLGPPPPSPPLPLSPPPPPPLLAPPLILTPCPLPLASLGFSHLASCTPPLAPSFQPVLYHPSIAQENCRTSAGAQMIHTHGVVSATTEMALMQPPTFGATNLGAAQPMPGFTPRPCESGLNDEHNTSQTSHPKPQFQAGSGLFLQRPHHSLPTWQAPTNYPHQTAEASQNYPLPTTQTFAGNMAYLNPMTQKDCQQPFYPPPQVPPSGSEQYLANVQSNDAWVAGRTGPSSPGVPFPVDGFYMLNMERPHQNFVYEHPLHDTMPSGPSVQVLPNHVHPRQWPSFDVPAHTWRPV